MVLPSTAWISSRSMFSHMVGPSAWNDRSQQVIKSSAPHTPDSSDVVLPARFQHRHGGQRHLGAPPSSTKQPRCHWKQTQFRPREATTPNLIFKKICPWSKHVLVYQELKAQKSHRRHRSGCSTLLRVPFRKLLVYVSLFISKYS